MILLTAMIALPIFADNGKLRIAVFDPTSSGTAIDEGTKVAVREIISSTIVNAGTYDIVERSLLEKVMQEQSFSNSGIVDDNDATEIGKLAGAHKVLLSVITQTSGRKILSVKMIDVKTASVERQKVQMVSVGELLDVVEPITLSLIDAASVDIQDNHFERPTPRLNEIVFYLPPGYEPKKEKDQDMPLIIKLDKETIGSGTLSTGFTVRITNPGGGVHKLEIGSQKSVKVDFNKYNFFEFLIDYNGVLGDSPMGKLGKALYGSTVMNKIIYEVKIKEQRMIK